MLVEFTFLVKTFYSTIEIGLYFCEGRRISLLSNQERKLIGPCTEIKDDLFFFCKTDPIEKVAISFVCAS